MSGTSPEAPAFGRGPKKVQGKVASVDFETYYSKKDKYSVTHLDPYSYVHDSRFDAYLVSIATDAGENFVGRPADFGWSSLDGALLLAHNAGFDGMVLNRLIELGIAADFKRTWQDTADMVAYLGYPRNLKEAAKYLLGIEVSKAVRSQMDGVTLAQALMAGQGPALLDYADDDAKLCLALWQKYNHLYPGVEREISRCNREAGWNGVHICVPDVKAGLSVLKRVRDTALRDMPWTNCEDPRDNKKPGSSHALAAHARGLGLPVPASFRKDDPEMLAWVEKYGASHPFITASRTHASVVTHIARLENMLELTDADGIIRFNTMYFGAHTGRMSAGRDDHSSSAKFNVLNQPKHPVFGVDMRGLLRSGPGHKFLIFDYRQIEPRITHWLAGNVRFLERLREIGNIYEADAVVLGLWDSASGALKESDPKLYASSKERVIGLGYGMGAVKFLLTCRKKGVDLGSRDWQPEDLDRRLKFIIRNMAGLNPETSSDYDEIAALLAADDAVRAWRDTNACIPALWKKVEQELMGAAVRRESVHEFLLPSGRRKPFFYPRQHTSTKVVIDPDTGEKTSVPEKSLSASVVMGRQSVHYYGGNITENLVQSIARDVLYYGAMAVVRESGGRWSFPWNVYDEGVFRVPNEDVDAARKRIPELMCGGPHLAWAEGLPLAVSGGVFDRYVKD